MLTASLLALSSSLWAAPVAAKKDGVEVTAEPKKGATVLVELKKGEVLEAGDREGMFWKVKTKDGKSGFVSVMLVQRQAGEDSALASALRDEALKARQNNDGSDSTRARSAVMGVRGLDESKDTAMAGNIRPDLRAVYRMEDRVVADNRVNRLEYLIMKEIENTHSKHADGSEP
ncbi:SH3 domain-containing protein [Oligoflexus tunisiensis]|uniref:SH3 domain-containing protein n=1 Tax=Oligoflexus tunisiensis TaxID=708132 RepID=UPI001C401C5C|nr:SH3 domain-containing protein [Oligoflexus tunisiensis]